MLRRHAPRVSGLIVGVTALAFLAQLMLAGPHIVLEAGFIPARASEEAPFDTVPFLLTPLTATLLHGGFLHLAMNLLMLFVCGQAVEGVVGGTRLLLLYVLGAYGAALAQWAVEPLSIDPMIGASGAISAVIGTYALMFGRGRVSAIGPLPGLAVRAVWLAAAWIVIQWGISIATAGGPLSIATAAHVGGFITGLIVTVPLVETRYR